MSQCPNSDSVIQRSHGINRLKKIFGVLADFAGVLIFVIIGIFVVGAWLRDGWLNREGDASGNRQVLKLDKMDIGRARDEIALGNRVNLRAIDLLPQN